jgi:transposase-like protein
LRNFLRPFRGVHKKYLAQYVAVFEWAYNLKTLTAKRLSGNSSLRKLRIPG